MAIRESYIAPVDQSLDEVKNLEKSYDYFAPIITKAYRDGNDELLRNLGACSDNRNGELTLYLAVDPQTGETAVKTAEVTKTLSFTSFIQALKGIDPDITSAQAATMLLSMPWFSAIKKGFPPEFSRLKILSFSQTKLTPMQEIIRNF